MPVTQEQAYKEAVASARQDVSFIDTIKIVCPTDRYTVIPSYPDFPTFRFARSEVDLVINGDTYIGRQFNYTFPVLQANAGGTFNITISDIARDFVNLLRKVGKSSNPILIYYDSYFLNAGTMAKATFLRPMEVLQANCKDTDLVISAGYPDIINKKVPIENYTLLQFPGLY